MAKILIVDPPAGWMYGFPKPMPKEIFEGGDTGFKEWLIFEGYPEKYVSDDMHCRYWEVEEGEW